MCNVPIGNATCQIDPNSPLYPGLNNTNGYEYLVGGYQGIVVVRTGWYDFVAYECTCPHDEGLLEMAKGYGNLVLECPECGSQFSTFGLTGCRRIDRRTRRAFFAKGSPRFVFFGSSLHEQELGAGSFGFVEFE